MAKCLRCGAGNEWIAGHTVVARKKSPAGVVGGQRALLALARLVLRETGGNKRGELPHEPREALLVLRDRAKKVLGVDD